MTSTKVAKGFSITMSYIVYAEPSKVFDALTLEGILGLWCDGGGKVEPSVDGEIEMFDGWVKGNVLVYDKRGKKLSYTWKPKEWNKKTAPSVVTYNFQPHAAGTEVFLEHTGLPTQAEADNHRNGWIDFVFEPLNDYFAFEQP